MEPTSVPEDLEPRALSSSLALATDRLHVHPDWIRDNVPNIQKLEVFVLQVTQAVATHKLRAHCEGSECIREISIEYDLPPPGESGNDAARRADRHRRLEERALRELDGIAATEHRARKAKQRQQARVIEAAVAECLAGLVDAVCDQAVAWEPALGPEHLGPGDWAWTPPAGASGPELVRIDARYREWRPGHYAT
jgi:hypothetical protein